MKQYAYYPGCSLESLAVSYHLSAVETGRELGLDLKEIDDWNCCGATAYFHVDELLANTLVARNLALAEKENLDFVAPCTGCYKNAFFTSADMKADPDLADHINYALEADNLHYEGKTKVRHLLEVFIEDVGYDEIVDFRDVPTFQISIRGLKNIGRVASNTDQHRPRTRLAFIVSTSLAVNLVKLYAAYRNFGKTPKKYIRAFKNEAETYEWAHNNQ